MIALIVVGYGVFYFYNENKFKNKPVGQTELSSNDIEQVVNKYLKQTTEKMNKERFDSEKAQYQALKQPVVLTTNVKETNPADVPVSKQIWKESDVASTPSEVISADMYDEMAMAKQDEEARKKYAKEFIENARRGGFHVVLSDDLTKIISVTPLRRPSQHDDSVESFPSN